MIFGRSPINEHQSGKNRLSLNVRTIETHEQLMAGKVLDQLLALAGQIFTAKEADLRPRLVHIINSQGKIYYVVDTSGENIIGFSAIYKPLKNDPIYGVVPPTGELRFGFGTVSPEHRSQGVYRALNRKRIGEVVAQKVKTFEFDTQNPRVEYGLIKVLEEYKQSHSIKKFTLERILAQRPSASPDTFEEPKPSGISTIDAEYRKLNRTQGEYYRLTFTLEYRK